MYISCSRCRLGARVFLVDATGIFHIGCFCCGFGQQASACKGNPMLGTTRKYHVGDKQCAPTNTGCGTALPHQPCRRCSTSWVWPPPQTHLHCIASVDRGRTFKGRCILDVTDGRGIHDVAHDEALHRLVLGNQNACSNAQGSASLRMRSRL